MRRNRLAGYRRKWGQERMIQKEFENKIAFVTGAGSGIGQAIALALAKQGACVLVNDIDTDSADHTAEKISALSGRGVPLQADVSDGNQVPGIINQAMEQYGTVDILVNNAGIGGSATLVKDMPPEMWDRVMSVNLKGALNCCRAVIPAMIEKRQGKIVNIASLAASRISKLGGADYTASKYGLVGFSRHLAFELAGFGINVNVVCPGATLTPLVKSKTTEEFRVAIADQIPLGRWIKPDDIAAAVLFLAGERAAMITGVVLDIDGGQLLGLASDYKTDLARRTQGSQKNLANYHRKKG